MMMFNLLLSEGTVPESWKEANVSKNKPENYRPLGLKSIICKLLKKLIIKHLMKFLVKHTLLSKSQHGFSKGRAHLTNLLYF